MLLLRVLVILASVSAGVTALGEEQIFRFPHSDSDRPFTSAQSVFDVPQDLELASDEFLLAHAPHKHILPFLLDSKDNAAVHLAAHAVADDLEKITGMRPAFYNDTLPDNVELALVAATVSSKLASKLSEKASSDVRDELSSLDGKWESYDIRVYQHASTLGKGLKRVVGVVGSDRRGTAYALYTLSELMGVSPFHFWSDVPHPSHATIILRDSSVLKHGEPTVKYRGLFINDEHPALWGWAQEHFKLDPWEPSFQPFFYKPWFDMMLRLRTNYFWPAMYASKFYIDGSPIPPSPSCQPHAFPGPNQELANAMGIVMGTSHHEPMSRNKPEWDAWGAEKSDEKCAGGNGKWDWLGNEEGMTEWWTYGAERAKGCNDGEGCETLFTLGMRGDGDEGLHGGSPRLVENITNAQLDMLGKVYGQDNVKDIPKMWAMYKEVANYYLNGLEVPDDVTILFSDDNYGNIMSVLPPDKPHSAGGGIYYHVDYVGFPRLYKWINTVNPAKTWEQMNIARAFNTTSIWIVNVGSLKPLEAPTEWFTSLAWDFKAWEHGSWRRWWTQWAGREFGLKKEKEKEEVADIMMKYSMMASRHKAELLGQDTFSLTNYEEAERVLEEWHELTHRASKVYHALSKAYRAPFYENVYMLCLMQENVNKLYIAAARSNLYAEQARTAANVYGFEAIELFKQDANLTESFHSMLGGKWNHMLDQTHINYYHHLEPLRDTLPPISLVQYSQPARLGIPIKERSVGLTSYLRVTVENSKGTWPGENFYNCNVEKCPDPALWRMDRWGAKKRWIDIGSGGPRDVKWTAKPQQEWLKISKEHGMSKRDGTTDERVYISVDWKKVPEDAKEGVVEVKGNDRSNVTVTIPLFQPPQPDQGFSGFVQGDGYVVMEAAHFAANHSVEQYAWQELEGYGRTLSGLEVLPADTTNFTAGSGPSLTYAFWLHPVESGNYTADISLEFGPSLNWLSHAQMSLAVSIDDSEPQIVHPIPTAPLPPVVRNPGSPPYDVGAVPADWMEAVTQEIRRWTTAVDFRREGKHEIKVYGMTTGLVLERVVVDVGGIKGRGYSYLGPPESSRV